MKTFTSLVMILGITSAYRLRLRAEPEEDAAPIAAAKTDA